MSPVSASADHPRKKLVRGASMTTENRDVRLNEIMTATRWVDHGDHPAVIGMNGHNWEYFPNESDKGCGLLEGHRLVHSGDWIIWSELFMAFTIMKDEDFQKHFSLVN